MFVGNMFEKCAYLEQLVKYFCSVNNMEMSKYEGGKNCWYMYLCKSKISPGKCVKKNVRKLYLQNTMFLSIFFSEKMFVYQT